MRNVKSLDIYQIDRIIEMAWEDRTPFEAIKFQFGLSESEVINLMRNSLKESSFKMWRKRVNSRVSSKHLKKEMTTYKGSNAVDKNQFQIIKFQKDKMFPVEIDQIIPLLEKINPAKYASTRNYKNGAVSRLSPYISRGFLSTKIIYNHIKSTGVSWDKAEKYIQELAWRDYWQLVWKNKQNLIFSDLKSPQEDVESYSLPKAVVEANTTIDAIDEAINELYQNGYMHNHMRMYLASLCCNIAKCHWKHPAKWMYFYLLDGDLASNMLSWQWVAGSNSSKKYLANQENINKFFDSQQKNTFLDISYNELSNLPIPLQLKEGMYFENKSLISTYKSDKIQPNIKTLVYNYYNLDPKWEVDKCVQRVFLLEPSVFKKYPVSQDCLRFALALSNNIPNCKLFVGEFKDLKQKVGTGEIAYKEHPLNTNYHGIEFEREYLSSITGYHKSFFSFWKKCKKEIIW